MAEVIFFEKPDDPAAFKQKTQLENAGHVLVVKNLLEQGWTAESLRPFFGERPVESWVTKLHPDVRSGKVVPTELTEEQALALMVADPTLIRRPLLQVGEAREAGFDPNRIHEWIGILPKGDNLSCDDKHAQGRCDHGHQHFPAAG